MKYPNRATALIFGIHFWFCEDAARCYRPPVSEPLDLTIIGGRLAGTLFAHPNPSETVLKGAEGVFGTATGTIRR